MIVTDREPALHWTCATCGLEWIDAGRGFPGNRFSECLRCGADAVESDAKPAPNRPRFQVPGTGRFVPPR
jgi:hypothetical protein